jgi:hypothetical protein
MSDRSSGSALLDDTLYSLLTEPGIPDLLISKASQGA